MEKGEKFGIITLFTLGGLLLGLWLGVSVMQKTGPRLSVNDGTLIQRMQNTCAESYGVIDGDLEESCGKLQDELATRGYETLNDNGKFWVER